MDNRKAKANARRLKATVQRVEQQPYDFASGRRLPRILPSVVIGKATGTITSRVGTTPGVGPVTIQKFDGTDFSDGVSTGFASNYAFGSVMAGEYVAMLPWGGRLWAIGAGDAGGFCRLASSLGPASGTWPSVVPSSQSTVTIYLPGPSSMTNIGVFQVFNFFSTVTFAAGKTTQVVFRNGVWIAVNQEC